MNENDLLENEGFGFWLLLLLLFPDLKNFEKELEPENGDKNHINGVAEQKQEE